jgi:hypothetical protein
MLEEAVENHDLEKLLENDEIARLIEISHYVFIF